MESVATLMIVLIMKLMLQMKVGVFYKHRVIIQIMNGYECNGTDIFMR